MIYEIQTKNDFITGSSLVIKIPESDVDKNALYTIQSDRPNFILPFHYKNINNKVEFTYKIGTYNKLQYFAGEVSSEEYIRMWQNILKPLLDCGDWFMNPCSFLLNIDHLYFNKADKTIVYLYVPSLRGCSGYEAFNAMTAEISKLITVSDAVLENKVLKSILENFNPVEFIKMLNDHISENECRQQDIMPVIELDTTPPVGFNAKCGSGDNMNPNEPAVNQLIKEKSVNDKVIQSLPEQDKDIFIDIKSGVKVEENKQDKESGRYRMFSSRSKRKKAKEEKIVKAKTEHEKKPENKSDIPLNRNLLNPLL